MKAYAQEPRSQLLRLCDDNIRIVFFHNPEAAGGVLMGTILIVDDSEMVRERLKNLLHGKHTLFMAENGEKGLEAYIQHKPVDLVITDLNMPVMNGIKMCSEIIELEKKKSPPIIVISSEADSRMNTQLKSLGVVARIIKPFKDSTFCSVVERMFKYVGKVKKGDNGDS